MADQSEFGRGLVVCLFKFARHIGNASWNECVSANAWLNGSDIQADHLQLLKAYEEIYGSKAGAESAACRAWISGAFDHLREIELPPYLKTSPAFEDAFTDFDNLARDLERSRIREKSIGMDDLNSLVRLAGELAMAIDKVLDLSPDFGKWD